MKLLICVTAFLVAGTTAIAQQTHEQLLTSDLVAWSFMQQPQQPEQTQPRPQPTPEPVPETQPSQDPAASAGPPPAGGQAPAAQTFTGTISKEAGNFVLKVSQTTAYKLDNQQQVQQYEGQRVRVTGTLDSDLNLIHVDRIEPLT
ncbi:MAG TPA: DUF5818 domain-containing protein [Terriglobales bacterium]|nr:DUF5818 domain-containing protein [Terriglobales bacterium]